MIGPRRTCLPPGGLRLLAGLALLAASVRPAGLDAQTPSVRGYSLNVATAQSSSPLGPPGTADLQRLRLMLAPRVASLRLDVAYEHTATWRDHDAAAAFGAVAGSARRSRSGLDWLVLERRRLTWRHRFDRLSVGLDLPSAELTVGRQAISWATTLFLTPADPFAPFDPADPFREYRPGVDAARLQLFPGPFSTVDLVAQRADGKTTALVRAKHAVGSWSLSAWSGALRQRPAAAAGAEGALGGWGVRAESELRWPAGRSAALRIAAGVDRRFSLAGRDLYLLFEGQHDALGAARPADFPDVLVSGPYARGELQLLSRDAIVGDARWQLHPLLSVELLALASLDDGSILAAPALSASISDEATLRLGAFAGAGRGGASAVGIPRSEFGAVPRFGYVALSVFF